ncbi:hypothetical protein SAMN05660841_03214 [Sphingobacterium nematocida]|uniref:cAMP-binding domain of CRP or a regulatory subunit of cAMP-dependent protein kinases n=1 Tax=Sphingobacterium nematocida TaxID=1513896 RepID=A0A1T5FFZ8_9SPHI|nr:hypothetical protein [Sphingobacterium nematocida]SKB95100.1 hypothetical protein SAMN05660841_03214 [Sphingobacterium nematocida]
MDRVENYFGRYKLLSEEARNYLRSKGRIIKFNKNAYYVMQNEAKHNWCFLLEGLVGHQAIDKKGNAKYIKLCPINHYFVGTKHIFSKSKPRTAIQFLQPSTIYTISNEDLKTGIRKFAELHEIYNIMKQHELDMRDIFLGIPSITREERLAYLYDHLPEVKDKMTVRQLCSLLGYSDDRQYYRALDYYNNRESS